MLSVFKKRHSGQRAGIAAGDQSVAAAVVHRRGKQRPVLEQCLVLPAGAADDQTFSGLLQKLDLSRMNLSAVIGAEDYQLVQVEAPDVLPAELRAAVRWRLRDAIDFPIEEATVDLFEIPDQSRRARGKMLFAVAARNAAVQRMGSALSRQARGFDVIDIPELCLRNLSELLPQDQKGVAMLMLRERFAQLVLTRQGVLYLTRRIEFARRAALDLDSGRDEIDAGALALELQRSLDYYESHYDQPAINELVLAPEGERTAALAKALLKESGLRVGVFNARELLDVRDGVTVSDDWPCLMAIGAALRVDGAER